MTTLVAFLAGALSGAAALLAGLVVVANLASDPSVDPDPERVE